VFVSGGGGVDDVCSLLLVFDIAARIFCIHRMYSYRMSVVLCVCVVLVVLMAMMVVM
jgi:hypothetical protein